MLRVSEDYGQVKYRLLEISDPRLRQAIANGEEMLVKGEDEAMLICNSIGCFKLREACISNQLLWTEDGQCLTMATGYLETVSCRGRVDGLSALLQQHALKTEDDHEAPVTWQHILAVTQATEGEIKKELFRLNAFEWSGGWRILAREFLVEICHQILQESLMACKPLQSVVESLLFREGVPDWLRISRILLEDELLQNPTLFWRPFQLKWLQKYAQLPPLTADTLLGIAWLEEHASSNDYRLRYLPSHTLPTELTGKLVKLFRERPRWPEAELMWYLRDGQEEDPMPFFLKNCRVMTDSQGHKWVTPLIPL